MTAVLLGAVLMLSAAALGLVIMSFRQDDTGLALAGMVVMSGAGTVAAVYAGITSA